MAILRTLSGAAAVAAALLLVTTLVAAAWLGQRATAVQRVVPHDDATAVLLDEVGTPVGRVDQYIILDSGAFLEGATDDGALLVSEPYLEANAVYPLQLKTVVFLRNLVGIASAAALVVFGGLWWWSSRRLRRDAAAA